MATPSKETIIKFKADTADYKSKINEMNQANRALTQELKLAQTQMKLTGTDVDKYKTSLSTLEKQYDIAKNKTRETAEQLQRTKQVWGENATETKKAEEALRRAQIAETEISNKIKTTTESLKEAKQAEALRNSEIGKSKQALEGLKTAHSSLKTEADKLKSAYDLQAASLGKNASETSKAKLQYDYLKQAQQNAGEQSRNLAQQLNNAKTAFGAGSEEVKRLETELNRARQAEIELGRETQALERRVGDSFKTAKSHVQEFGNKVKEVGQSVSSVGKDMSMKVTAPIAGAMGYAAKEASKFQHEMADIRKEVNATGLTSQQVNDVMSRMWDSSLANSQKFGVSTEKINEGLLVLVKDGYTAEEAMRIMTVSLHTARGANEDLSKTVDGLGSAYEATGQKTNNAEQNIAGINKMADIFAYTANHTKASVHSLTEAMSIIGPTANSAGQDLSTTASAVGLLQSNGIEASVAARALKSGFVNLTKPTKAMSKAMAKMGFSAFDANGQMKQLPQVMDELEHGLQGMTQEQQNATIATIFGKEHLASWQILVHSGGEKLKKMSDDARNATGEVKHLSEQMENTPENKFKELQQTLHTLAVQFGTEILPALMPVVEKLKELMDWISKLDPKTKQTIVIIAALAAAIGPLLIVIGATITAIGTIITAVGSVIGFIGTLIGWISAIAEAIGIVVTVIAAFVGAPVALVVAAIAAIIAAVVAVIAIFNNWGGITDWLKEKWSQFSTWMSELWTSISEGASKGLSETQTALSDVWTSITVWFSEQWASFTESWIQFWSKFGEVASEIWSNITEWFSSFWSGLVEVAKIAGEFLFQAVTLPLRLILTTFILIWELIKEPVTSFFSWANEYIQAGVNFISDIFRKWKEKLLSIVSQMWGNISSATYNIWSSIASFLSEIFDSITSKVSDWTNKASNIISSCWNYVTSVTSGIWNSTVSYLNNLWSGLVSKASSAFNSLRSVISSVYLSISSLTYNIWNSTVSFLSSLWGGLGSTASRIFNYISSVVSSSWNFTSNVLNSIYKPINSVIDFFYGLWNSIIRVMNGIIDTVSRAWNKAGGILNKLNPFSSSYSISVNDNTGNQGIAPASFAAPRALAVNLNQGVPLAPFSSGGALGDTVQRITKTIGGNGILSNLPNIVNNSLSLSKGVNANQQQPQEIKNEVTFNTTVKNESDLNKMFEKADDWFAKKGQMLNIGIGRARRG